MDLNTKCSNAALHLQQITPIFVPTPLHFIPLFVSTSLYRSASPVALDNNSGLLLTSNTKLLQARLVVKYTPVSTTQVIITIPCSLERLETLPADMRLTAQTLHVVTASVLLDRRLALRAILDPELSFGLLQGFVTSGLHISVLCTRHSGMGRVACGACRDEAARACEYR